MPHPHRNSHRRFDHPDFQFGYEIALGASYRSAADVGEVLVTAERIHDGDADAWVREWTATAARVRAGRGRPPRPAGASAAWPTPAGLRPTTRPRST
jgi:hypothetical protein